MEQGQRGCKPGCQSSSQLCPGQRHAPVRELSLLGSQCLRVC